MTDRLAARPVDLRCVAGFCFLLAAAFSVRFACYDFLTGDMLHFYIPWYRAIVDAGSAALGTSIPNIRGELGGSYTPPYYYLLYLASHFDGMQPDVYLIKALLLPFEFLAAFFAYRLVRLRYSSNTPAWLAACAVVFAPTVIANGALWGQTDILHSSLLLGVVYFALVRRYATMAMLFGAALAFKAQAVFLAPFLLMLWMRADMKLKHALLVPIAFGLMMTPALLLGRDPLEILGVYLRQGEYFRNLSMNAPNLYFLVPNSHYQPVVVMGAALTGLTSLVLALRPWWTRTSLSPSTQVLAATMFLALAPFLLPKMHDRYFFAADLLSIVLAFHLPQLWLVPLLLQASSGMAYVPIISKWMTGPNGQMIMLWTPIAGLLNLLVVAFLTVLFWRACKPEDVDLKWQTRELGLLVGAFCSVIAAWLIIAYAQRTVPMDWPFTWGWLQWAVKARLPDNLAHASYKHWMLLTSMFLFSYLIWRTAATWFASRTRSAIAVKSPTSNNSVP
jgi:Gpi18-like mannosyltransferase